MLDHQYDSDLFLIAIDNYCSSWCITNNMRDFVGTPTLVNVKVGGSVVATHEGTVKWSIEDDEGRRMYVKTSAIRFPSSAE
jgi:hypothetical protein